MTSPSTSPPIRILVVDDEPAHRLAIERSLDDARGSYHVQQASSLAEYWAAVTEQPPDIAIVDLLLPDGRAESVLRYPPESGRFPQVVMTSYGDEHIAVGAIRSGALDYVVKSPESFDQMPHTVERVLRTWAALSQREHALAQLRESEQRLRLAMEAAQMGAWDHDVVHRKLTWSQSQEVLMGFDPGTFPGTDTAYLQLIHPDSREIYAAAQERACSGDGLFQAELHFRLRDGRERWGLVRGRSIRDAHGKTLRLLGVDMDITERKLLEAQFLRAQRLEGIGSLASGVAHDLNNIFAPILMTAPLLRDTATDPESATMLDTIETCAQRGAEITRQLLTFARGTPSARVPLPIRHLVREMEKLIRETFPRDIQLRLDFPDNLWPVTGDPTQFHQALMNLCINARDAMSDGGTLRIAISNVNVDESFIASASVVRPGPHVCIRVSDSGSGIPTHLIDRIFDPFFTTKEIGKGTGLGLASVLGIVRGHDGFIRVTSDPGQGACFELYFPAATTACPTPETHGKTLPLGNGECVLLVDDEPSVRASMQRTLEAFGYRVLTATQGAEAVAIFNQQASRIRAIITDMMMPVMGGPELIETVRKTSRDIPILGMTGLPERQSIKGLDSLALAGLLTKPFSIDELARALAQALASREAHPERNPIP